MPYPPLDMLRTRPFQETITDNVETKRFYFECAQIEVGGSGAGSPGPMVKIPGLYDSNDPALRFFIYGAPNYPYTNIGQHTVWTGGAGGGNNNGGGNNGGDGGNNNGGGGGGATVPLYGQCGGSGYSGPTTCAEGTCNVTNECKCPKNLLPPSGGKANSFQGTRSARKSTT